MVEKDNNKLPWLFRNHIDNSQTAPATEFDCNNAHISGNVIM